MVGRIGLDKRPARQLAAPAAPHHLGEQREGPLTPAEILRKDRLIRIEHPHQRHLGEV